MSVSVLCSPEATWCLWTVRQHKVVSVFSSLPLSTDPHRDDSFSENPTHSRMLSNPPTFSVILLFSFWNNFKLIGVYKIKVMLCAFRTASPNCSFLQSQQAAQPREPRSRAMHHLQDAPCSPLTVMPPSLHPSPSHPLPSETTVATSRLSVFIIMSF